ncbi:helix-turn-helix domain-containing protein [Nocardioides bruguierae]|uniref:Helix-turn-helix domain-containing protein n=1 Tax=Nocardioides bruguierae TaxID=2945102 RepID=A0A9X2D678_9ACTN|nr:helix-turn-helix domain-containing protein [Nocardioides bruguierae]MCM0619805.1 helix-turn-helix domain-containing protein [Nocardioides bruguierae]
MPTTPMLRDPAGRVLGLDFDALAPLCTLCHRRSGTVDTETGICGPCASPIAPNATTGPKQAPARRREPSARTPKKSLPRGERDAEVIRRYQAGETVPTIATAMQHTPATIRRVLRASGVELVDGRTRRAQNKPSASRDPEIAAQVRRLYEQGHTQKQVADEVGLSEPTVLKIMRLHDIPRRPTAPPDNTKITDAQRQEIATRYAAGESAGRIAPDYGITAPTVYDALRRLGVPTRSKGARS